MEQLYVNNGFILLHRVIMDSWIWCTSALRTKRWIELLFYASFCDKKVNMNSKAINIKRGQMVTGTRKLMRLWNTNNTTVTSTLREFQEKDMIKMERRGEILIITIVNYDKYQFNPKGKNMEIWNSEMRGEIDDFDKEFEKNPAENGKKKGKKRALYNNINNKINKSERDARARESNELLEDFFQEQEYIENFCEDEQIDIEACKKLAKEVINDWNINDTEHSSKKEARKHLLNVLRIKVKDYKQKSKNGAKNRIPKISGRTGTENPLGRAKVHVGGRSPKN